MGMWGKKKGGGGEKLGCGGVVVYNTIHFKYI